MSKLKKLKYKLHQQLYVETLFPLYYFLTSYYNF